MSAAYEQVVGRERVLALGKHTHDNRCPGGLSIVHWRPLVARGMESVHYFQSLLLAARSRAALSGRRGR